MQKEVQIEADAAQWFTAMHSGEADQETRDKFETWLHGNRAHKVAYREFEQVYLDLDFVAAEAGVDLDNALGRSKTRWAKINLADFIPGWVRRPVYIGGAVLASAIAAMIIMTNFTPAVTHVPETVVAAAPEFTTRLAEIRELVLEDGSTITLGAKSRIETKFTETTRMVTLLSGEAFFEITKDPARPFFVAAQDTLVKVVGTKFEVKRSADIVHVSVLEGIVEVMKPNDIGKAIEASDTSAIDKQVLGAGERVSAARRVALPQARQIEQVEPGAWRKGRLAYEDASLAEIVADLNRYYDKPIRISSSEIGDLRSTLAFKTSEIDQVFDVIQAIHPIEVERTASGEIIVRRKQ